MITSETSLAQEICARLLQRLLAAFPARLKMDYFELCGLDRNAPLMPEEARRAFELISAMVDLLVNGGLAQGDKYADKYGLFYWDLGLSPSGFGHVRTLQSEGLLEGSASCQDLVSKLFPDPVRAD